MRAWSLGDCSVISEFDTTFEKKEISLL